MKAIVFGRHELDSPFRITEDFRRHREDPRDAPGPLPFRPHENIVTDTKPPSHHGANRRELPASTRRKSSFENIERTERQTCAQNLVEISEIAYGASEHGRTAQHVGDVLRSDEHDTHLRP